MAGTCEGGLASVCKKLLGGIYCAAEGGGGPADGEAEEAEAEAARNIGDG